jgi:hypothetical protein
MWLESIHSKLLCCCCFVLMLLGFEIGASCLLGRSSTAWATPPALFALVILGMGQPKTQILLFTLLTKAGVTDTCHYAQLFLFRWGLVNFFTQTDLELQSSHTQSPKKLWLQAWTTKAGFSKLLYELLPKYLGVVTQMKRLRVWWEKQGVSV